MTHSLNALTLAAGDYWKDTFFGLDADERFAFLIVAIGCGTGVVIALAAIVGGLVSGVHRRRIEAELKREMLDRGMSAEEIAKIIEAAPPPEDVASRWISEWCKSKKK